MNIVVASAHRNNSGRVRAYLQQVSALRDLVSPHHLRVIAAEGDSTDRTADKLTSEARQFHLDLDLVPASHGGAWYGSVEHPQRLADLSKVANAIFSAVDATDDIFFFVESDLLWDPQHIRQLINQWSEQSAYDVLAPLVMAGDLFYDVWGYRDLSGNRLSPFPPHHRLFKHYSTIPMSSIGSCFVTSAFIARECRVRNDNALVGWCADVRAHGYRIAATKRVIVRHPA